MAYHDRKEFATMDAMHIGRLHTHAPGWAAASLAFMRSGGYAMGAEQIRQVGQRTLVIWGRQDGVLGTDLALRFAADLPQARYSVTRMSIHLFGSVIRRFFNRKLS